MYDCMYICINVYIVEALKEIAKTLGKGDWNFSVEPCSGEYGWVTPNPVKGEENALTCNCSFSNDTSCQVISMYVSLNFTRFSYRSCCINHLLVHYYTLY